MNSSHSARYIVVRLPGRTTQPTATVCENTQQGFVRKSIDVTAAMA